MKKLGKILYNMYERFFEVNCFSLVALLTYSTLLSVIPMMLVSFYILSFFPFFHGAGQAIQEFIFANFVAESAQTISQHMSFFLQQMHKLGWYNFLALAFVSVLLMSNMVDAFNRIWGVKMRYHHFALSFVIYFVVLLIMPFIFGVLIISTSYLTSLSVITQPAYLLLPYFAAFIIFSFFNWVLPSCRVRMVDALIAGLVTTIFFELARYLFTFWIKAFPTYQVVYGALAAIPIFLLWVYISWLIVLIGALLCHALSSTRHTPTTNQKEQKD